MLENNTLTYDLERKTAAMRFFLKEIDKRKRWHCGEYSDLVLPQEGVTVTSENGKIRTEVKGKAWRIWEDEAVFFIEAYLAVTMSFFDILAKCLKKGWKGEDLYFKNFIDEAQARNPEDDFCEYLKNFKDTHLKRLSDLRNDVSHEKSLFREIKPFFSIKAEQGKPVKMRFLVCNLDGQEIEILDYLNGFQKNFDALLDKFDENYEKEY
ncbi:MAG: hypothetical protein WC350_05310 [Candidatus Micrarchaeia archaeon]|jgi:hypothetical protein